MKLSHKEMSSRAAPQHGMSAVPALFREARRQFRWRPFVCLPTHAAIADVQRAREKLSFTGILQMHQQRVLFPCTGGNTKFRSRRLATDRRGPLTQKARSAPRSFLLPIPVARRQPCSRRKAPCTSFRCFEGEAHHVPRAARVGLPIDTERIRSEDLLEACCECW
jgi:hypothetical protein